MKKDGSMRTTKILAGAAAAALALAGLTLLGPADAAMAAEPPSVGIGHQIYDAANPGGTAGGSAGGYRYGPTMIKSGDSIDMWTCSPPDQAGSWDSIRYRHSSDGGNTWTTDQVVLRATPGSADNFSACDPGVVKFGGYYYLSYGSTASTIGSNQGFVARSTSPGGPFEKWNGNGWGGNPAPFITYDSSNNNGAPEEYGAGEPALVVKDGTLYIYYTWISRDGTDARGEGNPIRQMRVSTASVANPNWPGALTYRGVSYDRLPMADMSQSSGEYSSDVKYVPSLGKFYAFSLADGCTAHPYVKIRESSDGITFKVSGAISQNIKPWAHNIGVTGDELGQLHPSEQNDLAYAYGANSCGNPYDWSTWMNPLTLGDDTDLPAPPQLFAALAQDGAVDLSFENVGATSYKVRYGTSSGSYATTVTTTSPSTRITGLTNGTTYFFTVTAVNAAGEMASWQEKSATPLPYRAAPALTASSSSTVSPDWAATNVTDGNRSTAWSSNFQSVPNSGEWVQIDLGAAKPVKRITVTPRQNEHSYPREYVIQTSVNGTDWTTPSIPRDGPIQGFVVRDVSMLNPQQVYEFGSTQIARYVRITSSWLNSSDAAYIYLMQIADIRAETAWSTTATITNKATGLVLHNAGDLFAANGVQGDNVPAVPSAGTDEQKWAVVDLGDGYVTLRNKATGKVVAETSAIFNGGPEYRHIAAFDPTNYPNLGATAQWRLDVDAAGYVTFVNRASSRVMHNTGNTYKSPPYNWVADVPGAGSDEQRWAIIG
jgi:hypothetical protein